MMVKPKDGFGRGDIVRLWTHESLRVFGDRLVDDSDREWFLKHLNSMVREEKERDGGTRPQISVIGSRTPCNELHEQPRVKLAQNKPIKTFSTSASAIDSSIK